MDGFLKALVASATCEKQRALVQFNRASGAAIGILGWVDPITLNNEHYRYVEVEACLSTDLVRGTIDSFEVYNPEEIETPEVFEVTLNTQAQTKVLKEYPISRQLNILRGVLTTIVDQLGISSEENPAVNELREMNGYIEEVLENNAARKEYFAESENFIYVSDAEAAANYEATLDGGLHEIYGARTTSLLPGV